MKNFCCTFFTGFVADLCVLQMLDEMPQLDAQKLNEVVMRLPDIQGQLSGELNSCCMFLMICS